MASNPTVITNEVEVVVDGAGVVRLASVSPATACFPAEQSFGPANHAFLSATPQHSVFSPIAERTP